MAESEEVYQQHLREQAEMRRLRDERAKHGLYHHGDLWYDVNGNVRGRGPTEDSPMIPIKSTGDEAQRRVVEPGGQVVRQNYRDTGDKGGTPTTTPAPTAPATPAKKGGQYTGADLAAAVKVDPALTKLAGGTAINDVELEKILADRIAGAPHQNALVRFITGGKLQGKGNVANAIAGDTWERARDLAEVIVDALPPELHNAEVGAALDWRPYVKELDGKKIVFRSYVSAPFLPDITKAKTVHTGHWITRENERLAGDAIVAGANGNTPTADTSFDTGTAGVVPVDPAAAGTSGITVGPNGEIVLPSSQQQQDTRFPIEGLRAAIQSGAMTLEEAAKAESAAIDAGGTGYFPVDVGKATAPMPGVPAASTDTVGITDALKYLYDVPPTEVHNLQLKMAAAGYFDKLDNGGTFIDGDPTDANTQAAWKQLLTDSITTKMSVPAVLGGGLRTYREQVRKSRLSQLQEMDPSYSMTVANDYAQSVTGKDLTPDQLDSLNQHLHSLVNARAGNVAGASGNQGGRLANTATGLSDDDIKAALDSNPQFKGEQRHVNDLALEFKLKGLMH